MDQDQCTQLFIGNAEEEVAAPVLITDTEGEISSDTKKSDNKRPPEIHWFLPREGFLASGTLIGSRISSFN